MTFSSFFSLRALPVLAVVFFLTSLHARGAVTTYEFTGTLTDIRESGAGFSYGDTFYARYTHDDAPQTGSLIESDRMLSLGAILDMVREQHTCWTIQHRTPSIQQLDKCRQWFRLRRWLLRKLENL